MTEAEVLVLSASDTSAAFNDVGTVASRLVSHTAMMLTNHLQVASPYVATSCV
jgi:hypothetical protein